MPQPFTNAPEDPPALETTLSMPYTLSTGAAAGTALVEFANRRIVGSRCGGCARVLVPAQDFCPECGSEAAELVELPQSGAVTAATRTADGAFALIRLDGTDSDLLHRLVDGDEPGVGERVGAVWRDDPEGSIMDIVGFAPGAGDGAGPDEVVELEPEAEPIVELPYKLELEYRHAYGPYYGRLFDEIASSRRILGVRCPSCRNVLVPPREFCDACFVRTEQWVDVADTGVIQAFSVIHLEFVGQTRKPPYVYAEIVLDGSATRLIHTVGGIDVAEAKERLRPGMRVRAVWKESDGPSGGIDDIDYFEPIPEAG